MRSTAFMAGAPALLIAVLLAGCQSASVGAPTVRVLENPDFQISSLKALGFLGLARSAGDAEAQAYVETSIEQALDAAHPPLLFLTRQQCADAASAAGSGSAFEQLMRFWRDEKRIDIFALREVCKAVGVDGVLLGCVDEWTREKPSWRAVGARSFTQVGVTLTIVDCESGHALWEARGSRVLETGNYEPSEADLRRTDAGGFHATPAERSVPEPPTFEEVVPELSKALVQKMLGH